ncbi:MAG: hypothetical protein ABFC84_12325 [Veillonellales bacterium]
MVYRERRYEQQGSAGIMALVVLPLLLALGAALVMLTSSESNISANFRDGIAAQYLAEAGVQHAVVKLKTDTGFVAATQVPAAATANTLNSAAAKNSGATAGTYTVTVTGSGNSRKIISTGTVNKAKRQVVVNITLPSGGGNEIYSYAIYSGDLFTIDSGATVNGPVGTQLSQYSKNGGTINNSNINPVDVSKTETLPAIPVSFDSNKYRDWSTALSSSLNSGNNAVSGNYFVNGDLNLNSGVNLAGPGGTSDPAVIYVKGGTNIGGNITGNVTIIANSGVNINSGITINGNVKIYANSGVNVSSPMSGNILVMANGDINLNSGTPEKPNEFFNAVMVATTGDIKVDNVTLTGVVLAAKTLTLNSGATVTYNSTVVQNVGLSSAATPFTVNSWGNQ